MSKKLTHSEGLHPEVVAKALGFHLRTGFRHLKHGRIRTVSRTLKLASKSHVLSLLAEIYSSCSLDEARNDLGVTEGTLIYWREHKVLATMQVLLEERVELASIRAVLSMPNYSVGEKRVLFTGEEDHDSIVAMVQARAENLRMEIREQAEAKAEKRLNSELEKWNVVEKKRQARRAEMLARRKAKQLREKQKEKKRAEVEQQRKLKAQAKRRNQRRRKNRRLAKARTLKEAAAKIRQEEREEKRKARIAEVERQRVAKVAEGPKHPERKVLTSEELEARAQLRKQKKEDEARRAEEEGIKDLGRLNHWRDVLGKKKDKDPSELRRGPRSSQQDDDDHRAVELHDDEDPRETLDYDSLRGLGFRFRRDDDE